MNIAPPSSAPATAATAPVAVALPVTAAAVLLPVAPAAPVPGHLPRFDQTLQQLLRDDLGTSTTIPLPQAADAVEGALPTVLGTADQDTEAAQAADSVAPEAALLASMWPFPPTPVAVPVLPVEPPPATAAAAVPLGAVSPAGGRAAGTTLPSPLLPSAAAAGAPEGAAMAPAVAASVATVARPAPAEITEGLGPQGGDRPAAVAASTGSVAQDMGLPEAGDAAPPAEAAARRPQALVDTLGDRIAWQLQRGHERVVIRLDPPLRGQIEIQIRHDAAGATQVHLQASHGEVVRQLQAIGDHLRQELSQRQGGGDVSVQVAQQSREHDGRQRQDHQPEAQQQPGRALDENGTSGAARFALAMDEAP